MPNPHFIQISEFYENLSLKWFTNEPVHKPVCYVPHKPILKLNLISTDTVNYILSPAHPLRVLETIPSGASHITTVSFSCSKQLFSATQKQQADEEEEAADGANKKKLY